MALPSFTPTGTIYDIVGVESGELTAAALSNARIIFTPNVASSELITWEGEFYRLNPVVATLDDLGTIGTDTRLLANDPGLNLDGLQWQVQVRVGLSESAIKPWWFDAPADGTTTDLSEVARVPGVAVQGTAGLPEQVGHAGQFLTTDGSTASWTEVVGGGGGSGANLSVTRTSTQVVVASDSGTDATLPAADDSDAGVMTAAQQVKLASLPDAAGLLEVVRDTIGTALVAGTNVTITPSDAGDTITVAATGGGGGGGDVTLTGVQTLTQKTIGDKLDVTAVSTPATPSAGTARLYAGTVQGVSALGYLNSLGVPIVVGRDVIFLARNVTGSTITKGCPVYISSASSATPNIAKAQSDATLSKLPAAGLCIHDIANNTTGMVMMKGVLSAVNTAAMGDGSPLYVGTTAGAFTNTRPAHPNPTQAIGYVENANATTGAILVNCGPSLIALHDGVNGASWAVGDGTGTTKSLLLKNAAGTGTLQWNPTGNRTLTLPDVTGTLALLDANNNFAADAFIAAVTSTPTAAGTTALTVNSTQVQVFTGTTTQTVKLPTTSVTAGMGYTIVNRSTGEVTVQSSASNVLAVLPGSASVTSASFVATTATPTTAANWSTDAATTPEWGPLDCGWIAWNFDPAAAYSTSTMVAGYLGLMTVKIPVATTITNLIMCVGTAGVSLTANQCKACLYQNGSLLASTADQATAWTTPGVKTMALTAAQAVEPGYVQVGYWGQGTTMPLFVSGIESTAVTPISNAGNRLRYAYATAGGVTTTAPGTLGAVASLAPTWVAVS